MKFGTSQETQKLLSLVEKIAKADAPVLVTGETGTGKEVIARTIHLNSVRNNGPFVPVNCGAFPDQLIQSELFGYEKGSFTGAVAKSIGKIQHADGGTLFLDEIGDLPINQQANLLRFLQDSSIVPIGGREQIHVDVRIIAATHVNLQQVIRKGSFREDLFHRLNVLQLHVCSLRDRPEDIEVLAKHFAEEFLERNRQSKKVFCKEAMGILKSYPWPGNVRELNNRVKRAIIMSEGETILPKDLGLERRETRPAIQTLKEAKDQAEKSVILFTLRWTNQNIPEAAKLLEVTRATLYRLIEKHNIQTGKSAKNLDRDQGDFSLKIVK